jgi:hypothetical protein
MLVALLPVVLAIHLEGAGFVGSQPLMTRRNAILVHPDGVELVGFNFLPIIIMFDG